MMGEAPRARIRETKRALDGRRQTFDCGLVFMSPRLAIICFEHPGAGSRGGFFFPAGSYTLGFFWARRHYNLYRFTGPDDTVIAYRFDVVDAVRITPTHVSYTDLLLDAWLSIDGRFRVEDEEEVAAAARAGLLSDRRLAVIHRTRHVLERAHHRIVVEAEHELARARSGHF